MKFLIPTITGDFHAAVVALELQARGHEVVLWYGEDFPKGQRQSIRISGDSEIRVTQDDVDVSADQFDVVWNRRRIAFSFPEGVHEEDKSFAKAELRAFTDNVWSLTSPDAYWVNPIGAAIKAKRKAYQLLVAQSEGFHVPQTLMSNDPAEIMSFVSEHQSVIYKSFMPAYWMESDGIKNLFATKVDKKTLLNTGTLALCPGIYQELVNFDYEIRVTVFGGEIFALKLIPDSSRSTIDSREGYLVGMRTELCELPASLKERIFSLMERLGLRFGCLDVSVMKDGRCCFFEINEAGQFLWVEEYQPSVAILDAFCSYLESTSDSYVYRPRKRETRLEAWRVSPRVEQIMQKDSDSKRLVG